MDKKKRGGGGWGHTTTSNMNALFKSVTTEIKSEIRIYFARP